MLDQKAGSVIREEDVLDVHRIVDALTTRTRRMRDETPAEQWFKKAGSILVEHSIAILVALLVLILLSSVFQKDRLRDALFVVALLAACLILAASFIGIGGAIPFFNRLRKTPFAPLLSSVRDASLLDLPLVSQLLRCDHEAVRFVLAQYAHERRAFERRGGMFAGALDKIGFFPAIAAFVGVAATLWAHEEFPLARALVFLVPAFYLMNFWAWGLMQEMDRTIAMLEFCVNKFDRKE
ncbi:MULTISPECIES: hypothetical protein [unclassified Caballeronia]|uniref:hypothetical protein n=1 Tax=unclassified Caballeronia TaxID=2646786 RepID=UPI001F1FCC9E|nr:MULTISPECIES: hypothetical protein [unclassified Caballeronia]MCE4545109.1 hypothetical protein [Caballeronia sp. PC1]MCE4570534.1 hypothetical protein [Caballeronia sp. CLC5]